MRTEKTGLKGARRQILPLGRAAGLASAAWLAVGFGDFAKPAQAAGVYLPTVGPGALRFAKPPPEPVNLGRLDDGTDKPDGAAKAGLKPEEAAALREWNELTGGIAALPEWVAPEEPWAWSPGRPEAEVTEVASPLRPTEELVTAEMLVRFFRDGPGQGGRNERGGREVITPVAVPVAGNAPKDASSRADYRAE